MKVNARVVILIGVSAWAAVAFLAPAMILLAYGAQGVMLDAKDKESLVGMCLAFALLAGIVAPAAYCIGKGD